ncbi:hypothetical protein B0J14DRAFT_669468 [Halenospora varia]|nr:hypothetical protein B0J14DRAFT_669468 [Halenospora varia]
MEHRNPNFHKMSRKQRYDAHQAVIATFAKLRRPNLSHEEYREAKRQYEDEFDQTFVDQDEVDKKEQVTQIIKQIQNMLAHFEKLHNRRSDYHTQFSNILDRHYPFDRRNSWGLDPYLAAREEVMKIFTEMKYQTLDCELSKICHQIPKYSPGSGRYSYSPRQGGPNPSQPGEQTSRGQGGQVTSQQPQYGQAPYQQATYGQTAYRQASYGKGGQGPSGQGGQGQYYQGGQTLHPQDAYARSSKGAAGYGGQSHSSYGGGSAYSQGPSLTGTTNSLTPSSFPYSENSSRQQTPHEQGYVGQRGESSQGTPRRQGERSSRSSSERSNRHRRH